MTTEAVPQSLIDATNREPAVYDHWQALAAWLREHREPYEDQLGQYVWAFGTGSAMPWHLPPEVADYMECDDRHPFVKLRAFPTREAAYTAIEPAIRQCYECCVRFAHDD